MTSLQLTQQLFNYNEDQCRYIMNEIIKWKINNFNNDVVKELFGDNNYNANFKKCLIIIQNGEHGN